MTNQFNLEVGAILNTKNVEKTLKDLDAKIIKTRDLKVNVKVGDETIKAVKTINTLKDAYGNLYQQVKVFDKKGKEIKPLREITQIKEAVNVFETLTTSTNTVKGTIKDLDKTYQGLITTTEKVNTNGEYLKTVISKYTNEVGQAVEKTEQFDKAGNKVATTMRKISDAMPATDTKRATFIDKEGNQTITEYKDGVAILRTEIKKYTDEVGNLIVQTDKYDAQTNNLISTHQELKRNIEEEVKTEKKQLEQLDNLITKINEQKQAQERLQNALISNTTKKTKGTTTQFGDNSGKEYEALITTIERVDKEGQKTIKTIYEFVNAEGQLVKQTRITDQYLNKIAEDTIEVNEALKKTTKATNAVSSIHKYVDNIGRLVTETVSFNEQGEKIVKTVIEENKGFGQLTTTTKILNETTGELISTDIRLLNDETKILEKKKELAKVEQEEIQRKQQLEQYSKQLTTTTKEIEQTIQREGNAYKAVVKTIEEETAEYGKLTTTIITYKNSLGEVVVETTKTNEAGEHIAQNMKTVTKSLNDASSGAKQASEGIKELDNTAERANYGVRNLGWTLSDAFSRLANFYLASLPLRALQDGISNTIETLKEFDSALIEFRKVSDLAGESLTKYVAKLAEMGEVTGSTMQAMVEAATEFRKSGFTDDDSAKLASIAEKYRNIADEEISAGESASFIIAQMKAFNIEADQAEHIIDSVNEVANRFSVSSADLAKNLGNMSAIMAINNVSMEEQIGMLTGVTEITRNASSASRGLVMVSSRLTQVLDDTSSTGKKLTAIYGKLGIELKDSNGQLRSHYDILGDLAEQWDSLSENEQKYIALTSAGARQQQNFVSLMENWNQVVKATNTAYTSLGSAQKENAKVMDSIEKKTQILKSEFQKLVIGEGGLQDANKTILDLGIALLKLANTPVGKITLEIALLTAGVFGLVTAIHSLTIAMATNPLLLLITALAAVVVVAIEVADAEDEMTRAHRENIEAVKEAQEEYDSLTNEINRLKEALKDIEDKKVNVSNEDDLRTLEKEEASLKRQIELLEAKAEIERKAAEKTAKEELKSTYTFVGTDGERQELSRTDAITEQKKMLEELSAEYDKLDEKERQQTIDLSKMSDAGTEAYRNLEEEIRQTTEEKAKLGHQIEETESGFHEFLQETEDLGEALTSTDKETVQLREDLFKGVGEGLKYFKEQSLGVIKEELKQLGEGGNVDLNIRPRIDTKEFEKAKWNMEEVGEGYATVFTTTFSNKAENIAINFTPIQVDENGNYVRVLDPKEFNQYCQDVVDGVREDDLKLQIGAVFEGEDAIEKADEAAQRIHELHEAEDELTNSINAYNSEAEEEADINQDVEGSLENLVETLGITAKELEGLKKRFDDLELENFLSQIAQARQEVSDYSTVIDGLQESLEAASTALEEYNENGYLTLDTFQGLMSISAQYLAALVNEEGQLEINQTTLGNLVEQLKVAKIEELQHAAAMEIAANHTDDAKTASANAEGAVQSIGNTIETTGQKALTAAGHVATFAASVESLSGVSQKDWTAKDRETVNRYKDLAKQISEITVNTTRAGNAAKSAGKKGASAAKSAKDATKELNKELEETKKKYDTVIKWIGKQYDKKINAIKKEKDAALKPIEAEIKAREKAKDKALDAIEAQINALEKEKKAREKYWQDQIDALKAANDARKDALELQEKLDALEKARNTKVKIYKEGEGFVYDVDRTAVAEAQKELDEYLSEKAYEDELERLENLKDAESDNYQARLDALNEYKDNVQKSYEEQIEALKAHKEALEEQYDAEVEKYQEYKQQFEDMVNAYQEQQDKLLAEQLLGTKLEGDNWLTRLDNLATFVSEYNKLQAQLDTGNTSVSNSATMKSGGTNVVGNSGNKAPSTTSNAQYDSRGFKLNEGYSSNNGQVTQSKVGYIPTEVAKKLGTSTKVYSHASGVGSIKDNELAIVGENPNQEIVIGSKLNNGELMSLNRGAGVVNANSSTTLAGMLNQVGKFGASGFGSGNGTLNNNINNDSLTINGVTIQGANISDPQTFVNGLLSLKTDAIQRAYKHR